MCSRKLRTVAIAVALSVASLVAVPASAAYPRLGDDVVPIAESVALTLDPARPDYDGQVTIDLTVRRATPVVRFHARGQELSKIALTGSAGQRFAVALTREGEIATLTAVEPLPPGQYRLTLAFHQAYNTNAVALYRAEFEGRPYLFTQFESTDAREAFPCWDEPGFKIPWALTLTVPADLLAVSNTPIESERIESGQRVVAFAKSPPLPSYLVALAVGSFETVPVAGTSVPVRIVTVKGQSGLTAVAVRETPAILAAAERYFGRPYPFAKLDLIAVPEFAYGAMENPGAITFADSILLVAASAGPAELRSFVRTTAHEIAHMWFGDLVTMQWWDDLWLNESFADWLARKISEEVHPELEVGLQAARSTQSVLLGDALATTPPIRLHGETTPEQAAQNVGAVYAKGNAVLSMVENWIGAATFRRGVIDYLEAHAWGNAVGPDLWRALGKAAGKDVAGVLAGFVDQPGVPLVQVERVSTSHVVFRQRRYAAAATSLPELTWNVPLVVRYRDDSGVRAWSGLLVAPAPQAAASGSTLEIELPHTGPIQWLMPNAGAAGYYRWTLPAADLEALVAAAASDLSPPERIDLIGNLRAQLEAAALPGDRYLGLLARLAEDREPGVQGAVIAALDAAGQDLVPEAAATDYAAFLRRTLGARLLELGWRQAPAERESVQLLRPALLRLLGNRGDDVALRAEARRLCDAGTLDETVADIAFRLAAGDGDRALWENYRQRFETAKSPQQRDRFLGALGSFRDPTIVEATLAYALTEAVRPTERLRLPFLAAVGAHREQQVFAWMTTHYEGLAKSIPPFLLPYLPNFGGGCSAERWQRTETFFADPAHRAPGIEQNLAEQAEEVQACLRLRGREGAGVTRWLAAAGRAQ